MVFNVLIGLALLATTASLLAGLVVFWRGDSKKASLKSNQLMRWRLLFQAMVILIFSLALFLRG